MSEGGAGPRRGRGTPLDLVRSLALVLGVVAVVLVLAPQPRPERLPALDDAAAVTAAAAAGTSLDVDPVLLLGGPEREVPGSAGRPPLFLGEGWQLDYARTEQVTDDVPTWRQGLLSPEDRRVDVEQARSAEVSAAWLTRDDGPEARQLVDAAEPLEVDGVRWDRVRRADERTAYVRDEGGVTTAVSATDDAAYLVEVVELLSAADSSG